MSLSSGHRSDIRETGHRTRATVPCCVKHDISTQKVERVGVEPTRCYHRGDFKFPGCMSMEYIWGYGVDKCLILGSEIVCSEHGFYGVYPICT